MAVALLPTGAVLGGLTRKDDGSVTCACRAQGNADTTAVALELSYSASYAPLIPGTYTAGAANAGNNYVATAYFTGAVQENRPVYWRARLEGAGGPVFGAPPLTGGQFLAPPSRSRPRNWRIAALGCTQLHDASTNANLRAYNVELLRRINRLAGDGLIHFGDTLYPENSTTTGTYADYLIGEWYTMTLATAPADVTVARMRTLYMTMLATLHHKWGLGFSPAHLYAARPLWCDPDDHENIQPAGAGYPPPGGSIQEKGRQVGYPVYAEYFGDLNRRLVEQDGAVYSADWLTPVLWHRWNYWPVEFLYPDSRGYQNVQGTDDASKTLASQWTSAQRTWFENRLRQSVAPIIVVVSTLDLDGKHGFNLTNTAGDNWLAATHARDEMLELIWTIRGYRPVVFIAGDTHNQSVTVYDGKRGNRPRLWSFCASNGASVNGHDQTIGWMGRLMGLASFEGQGKTGWGGKPVLNVGSPKYTNNLLTLDAGLDSQGAYLRPTIWVTWPTNSITESVAPHPIYAHEFRAAA